MDTSAPDSEKKRKILTNNVVGWIGIGVTMLAFMATKIGVSRFFHEGTSEWAKNPRVKKFFGFFSPDADYASSMEEDGEFILNFIDPRKWKSTIASFTVGIGGIGLSQWAVNKVYHQESKSPAHPVPVATVNTLPPATSWQDKLVSAPEGTKEPRR